MKRSTAWLAVVVVLVMGTAADAAVEIEYQLDSSVIVGTNPLPGVPEYIWWHGCAPTAGGMMVGHWDGKAGYENLFDGDASYWWGETNPASGITGTRSMVAGTAHILAGGTWEGHDPDSLADFMRTEGGGTDVSWMRQGLEDYVEWDNPTTATDESSPGGGLYFDALVELDYIPYYGGSFDYGAFKAEIDAGRPVSLIVTTYTWTYGGEVHSVVGYGYRDDMFELTRPLGLGDDNPVVTVGGMAVMDTWSNGTAQSDWAGPPPGYDSIPSVIEDGVEWWPFLEFAGWSFPDYWDWMVYEGMTMDVAIVPEPASIVIWFLLGGLCVFAGWRRRRKAAGRGAGQSA